MSEVVVKQNGEIMPDVGSIIEVTYKNGETMEYVLVKVGNQFTPMALHGMMKGRIMEVVMFRTITKFVEHMNDAFGSQWKVMPDKELGSVDKI